MNKEEKKLTLSGAEGIVPHLRYPEFKEDKWDNTNLGSIGKPLMCKRIFKEETTTNPENAIPFFKIGTFGAEPDAYIPIELYEEYKKKYSFPKIGDILISASGTIGRLVVYDGSDAYYQDSNIVWLGHNEKKVLNTFLYYCYSTLNWQTSDGGVIKRLYNSNLKEMEIFYPKNPAEQQKIAACLSSLDEVITAETEKLDLLQDHKKGLLQQLFPAEGESQPKYRFPEFKDDGDWEETTLGEITKVISVRNKENKKLPVYSISNKDGFVPQSEQFEGVDSSDRGYDISLYKVIGKNTFAYNPARINIGSIGYSAYLSDIIISSLYVCFKTTKNVNDWFLWYFFQTNHFTQAVLDNVEGGIRNYLFYNNFSIIKIHLPRVDEQQKIAACLSAADELLEAQTQKIEALQEHKKGLLQQLFPNVNELVV
jgi:type I restriction enzyme S subunit